MMTAQISAGFESSSGFREALARLCDHDGKHDAQSDKTEVLIADWISTPLGPMLAAAAEDGIVMLDFTDEKGFESAGLRLRRRYRANGRSVILTPGRHAHLATLRSQLDEYFAGQRRDFSVPLSPHGTEFEMRVWRYLQTIPFGQTRSYGQQARAIGSAAAARAVGRANGCNDIGILIPCHRVIGAGGDLTGYGGGLARKRWLLNHEQQPTGR
jgi:AraC family transcriptional regulator, regulatory protein of adaptative response / methylated-DNA-[protein]-cysteine methyltransferase